MSRRPKCASTASTLLKTASALLTSHCSAIHLISFSCSDSSRLTRSAAVPSISIQTRLQPARAKAWAVASPRPLPAPVTRATFPFKMLSLIYLFPYLVIPQKSVRLRVSALLDECEPEILRCAQDDRARLCHPERSEGSLAHFWPITSS